MDDVGNHWFDRRGGKLMNCQSSRQYMHSQLEQAGDTAVNSMAACKEVPSSVANPCYSGSIANRLPASNWNPLVCMPEQVDFIGYTASSYGADTQGSQRVSSPGVRLIDQIQSRLCFSSENFSEMVNYFALSEDFQSTGALGPTGLPASDEHGIEKDYSKEKKRNIQELAASDSQSKFHLTQTSEAEHKEGVLPEPTKSAKEKDVKKPRIEQNTGIKTHKLTSKQEKENSSNADAPKEDYIHVRAKRGQATNSHSLAERLRREKISERMKFLQDLIPGCSKITGKAVMLDEIINYVQSLQRQVEFLSMKLATVSPELNYDVEQIFSKDIFLPQTGGSALLQFGPGFSTPYHQFQQPIPQGVTQFEVGSNPNSEEMGKHTLTHICPVAQMTNVWDADLQSESVMRMGFIPNAHLDASIDQAGSTMIDQ